MRNGRIYTERCPNCEGKGHVFDSLSLLIAGLGWIMAPFERNDPEGLTRKECPFCEGTGRIEVE